MAQQLLRKLLYIYLKVEVIYLKVILFLLVTLIGPWTGVQAWNYLVSGERYDLRTGLLCMAFQTLCLLLLCTPRHIGVQGIWLLGGVVCLSGHWVIFWLHERTCDPFQSRSEFVTLYLSVTSTVLGVMTLPFFRICHFVCCHSVSSGVNANLRRERSGLHSVEKGQQEEKKLIMKTLAVI